MSKKLKKFQVRRVWSNPREQYTIVEAEDREEAEEMARNLDENQWEDCWDNNNEVADWEYTIGIGT